MRWLVCVIFLITGFMMGNITLGLLGALIGGFTGWFVYWLYEGRYRANLLPYLTPFKFSGTTVSELFVGLYLSF